MTQAQLRDRIAVQYKAYNTCFQFLSSPPSVTISIIRVIHISCLLLAVSRLQNRLANAQLLTTFWFKCYA